MKNSVKKLLCFGFFFVCAMLLFSVTAFAYIDPSAMTYIIQMIAGIAIAAGAAFGFYWRKIKRALTKNKSKEASFDYDDDDDDDDYGMSDYSWDEDGEPLDEPEAKQTVVTEKRSDVAASVNTSAASAAASVASVSSVSDISYDIGDIEIPTAPVDPYDETGVGGNAEAENRELRRLLAIERRKVDILLKTIHICTENK